MPLCAGHCYPAAVSRPLPAGPLLHLEIALRLQVRSTSLHFYTGKVVSRKNGSSLCNLFASLNLINKHLKVHSPMSAWLTSNFIFAQGAKGLVLIKMEGE